MNDNELLKKLNGTLFPSDKNIKTIKQLYEYIENEDNELYFDNIDYCLELLYKVEDNRLYKCKYISKIINTLQ